MPSKTGATAQSINAFRACHQRFEDCREFADSYSASPLMERAASFVLDFDIIAKRAIGAESSRYRLFQMHFLKSMNRAECREKLSLTAWAFASEVLMIERTLGEAFSHAGLFPVMPYFTESNPRLDKIAA